MKKNTVIIFFGISLFFSLRIYSQSNFQSGLINPELGMEMSADKPGMFFGGGIGYAGNKSMTDVGIFGNIGYGFSRSFTLNGELSYYSFERSDLSFIKSPKLKIITLEPDLLYTWYMPGDKAFIFIGGNANVNYLSGDKMQKTKKGINGLDSTYYTDRDENYKFGFGVTIGFGIRLFPKFNITAEYMARGILGVDDTPGDNSMGWGGVKLGLRYYPNKK
ncbi:MAG: hypothetical protein JST15_07035 [Bacteroidetes bacterium]|nr:hypothetical protein [Bacteroidota bacterium]